ncbi:MAG: metal-dependent hydrolase [Bacteroidales bacterium]|nr:metal-dependent hydrolase [Bacteroidales bacterium]
MKRLVNYLTLLAVICLGSCAGKEPIGGTVDPDTPSQYKIMSFNIRYVNANDTGETNWEVRKYAIGKMIAKELPDVVGMNEARTAQRNDMKTLCPQYTHLEVPGTGTGQGGNVTMMFLTEKFNLLESKSFYLSETPSVPSLTFGSGTQWHTCLWAKLEEKATGRSFYVFATHLNTGSTITDINARTSSAKLIVERIKAEAGDDTTVYLLGDMNCSWAEDDAKRVSLQPFFDYGLRDARTSSLATDNVISFNGFSDKERTQKSNIDFIFYRKATSLEFRTITSSEYGVTYLSDHWPVVINSIVF